jgi:hypothetical protein
MAYIGNNPEVNSFTIGVEKFNGTGACTQFTLTRDIDDANAVEIIVNGVIQTPVDSYSVTNGIITFTEPPSSGSNNVIATYRAPVVITFNQVSSSQLLAGAVTETALATDSVTTTKIANSSITTIKVADDSIITSKIANSSITTIKIANNSITGEKISTPADIFDDAFLFGGM